MLAAEGGVVTAQVTPHSSPEMGVALTVLVVVGRVLPAAVTVKEGPSGRVPRPAGTRASHAPRTCPGVAVQAPAASNRWATASYSSSVIPGLADHSDMRSRDSAARCSVTVHSQVTCG